MGPNEEFREARPDWRLVDLCVVRSWGVDRTRCFGRFEIW